MDFVVFAYGSLLFLLYAIYLISIGLNCFLKKYNAKTGYTFQLIAVCFNDFQIEFEKSSTVIFLSFLSPFDSFSPIRSFN